MSTHVIFAVGIPSDETLGSPYFHLEIRPTAISSSESFGLPRLNCFPDAIASEETFGIPACITSTIYTYHIASSELFGVLSINLGIYLFAVPTTEILGIPVVLPGAFVIYPTEISSSENFGIPSLAIPVEVDEIPSSETFGWVKVIPRTLTVPVFGIPSEESFGSNFRISIISNSINYLPVYHQGQDFFKMICDLVDYVRTKDYLQWEYNDDQALLDKATAVIPFYHDTEAILAYYKFMIKPILGTAKVLDYLGKLVQFDESDIQEWFEYGGNVWHFKVLLGRVAAPIENFEVLYNTMYDLIMDYKNERSYLEELHIYVAFYTDLFVGMIPLCGEDVTIYDIEIMVSNLREVNSISSSEAFGILRFQVMPVGLLSEEHIGYPALNGMVPFGIESSESFGMTRFPIRPVGFEVDEIGRPRFPVFPVGIKSGEKIDRWTRIGQA